MSRYFPQGPIAISSNVASGGWYSANGAWYVPIEIEMPIIVTELFVWNGTAAVTGNWDMGLYTADGTRLVSIGSTAQAGQNTIQKFNITDTLLTRGLYYLALVASSTGTTYYRFTGGVTLDYAVCGQMKQAAALPLPATATFASALDAFVPLCGYSGTLI